MLKELCVLFSGRIFFLRFNREERVQEIFFLRQLSHDEAARKVFLLSTEFRSLYRVDFPSYIMFMIT